MTEINFDGLVGPTHNYAGLSAGNLASEKHGGNISTPRAAALQGLEKMRELLRLGVRQGVLPPHPRPNMGILRRLGFIGTDEQVLARVATDSPFLLRLCSSASAMWTANAATIAPATDTLDGVTHLVPANLAQMFHRQTEVEVTHRILSRIFGKEANCAVHAPLPMTTLLGDEGAANHTRLKTETATAHLFAWGRSSEQTVSAPQQHPARQSLEASRAVARLLRLEPQHVMFAQQSPAGIDGGAFHTDVLAVGNENFLMLHEAAFAETPELLEALTQRLGSSFQSCLARESELPIADAVGAYPFNSQLVTLPQSGGTSPMAVIAPTEAAENLAARRYLERVLNEDNPVTQVIYQDVRESMSNGGGPACLRLRVELSSDQIQRLGARVLLDEQLLSELVAWVLRYYPEQLHPAELADPKLARNSEEALDNLTQILRLGSIYEFQR